MRDGVKPKSHVTVWSVSDNDEIPSVNFCLTIRSKYDAHGWQVLRHCTLHYDSARLPVQSPDKGGGWR